MRDVRGHVVEREEVHIFYIYDLIYAYMYKNNF